jgi:hypothetical protein
VSDCGGQQSCWRPTPNETAWYVTFGAFALQRGFESLPLRQNDTLRTRLI